MALVICVKVQKIQKNDSGQMETLHIINLLLISFVTNQQNQYFKRRSVLVLRERNWYYDDNPARENLFILNEEVISYWAVVQSRNDCIQ